MPPRVKPPAPLQHHVRAWRKHKKMTLQQVADAVGSSKGHLSYVESGTRELMPGMAAALAHLFGVEVETMLKRKPGEDTDLEADLLALFRGGDTVQRRAIVDMARAVRSMDRRSVREPDHDDVSLDGVEPG